ncbi:MAG: [FeFe] hydrogenase H-cluster maturation GTPase HydF [Synergistaceae bacterium]|nr:[FeFe] hydrogenase H-cluster maturation GTPase HydF [Synergistaceae bacterium]
MNLNETPRSNRLHIGFYGRRNAGKSSLINLMTGHKTALVSEVAGTTTDPVIKSMELLPLGPISVIDTAGLDDEGILGELRIARSKEMMARTDLAVLVIPALSTENIEQEQLWLSELRSQNIPIIGVLNQIDKVDPTHMTSLKERMEKELGIPFILVSALNKSYRADLLSAIVQNAPTDFESPTLVGDLFSPGDRIVLVMPQDIQAPKGRLILPQVQVIRDILDHDGLVLAATTDKLPELLNSLKEPPNLVITDSQFFKEVEILLPKTVPLTSFSIVLARNKGDLGLFIRGAETIENLKETDRVLIAEACTHAPLTEDIGREKIPRWLRAKFGKKLQIDVVSGIDFPKNLKEYALIIHCGGCMFTRKQLMSRLIEADGMNVPITNYGLTIAYLNGILDRSVEIFINKNL